MKLFILGLLGAIAAGLICGVAAAANVEPMAILFKYIGLGCLIMAFVGLVQAIIGFFD